MESILCQAGQSHLLEGLEAAGKTRLLSQALRLDAAYGGGLKAYVQNARRLLQASARGDNPFDGCTPEVPTGEKVNYGDARSRKLEERGRREARKAAFVVVAGGLGERLGFSGIKLALPSTIITGISYLELYCRGILALQAPADPGDQAVTIPFVVMTSDDTHDRTVQLLEAEEYFGLKASQVYVLKQEKVACLMDSDACLAKDPKDPSQIETKPHGHGDVHSLLHASGLARKMLEDGFEWLVFFQDTNGLFFRALLPTLGVSAEGAIDMNSVSVPRRPKDAMGAITRLVRRDGSSVTMNVEYNQLDPLLRSTVCPDGDAADASGLSPFPGNINTLIVALKTYVAVLDRTGGAIAEFVNPKYADATKTKFKSSTRLECMMQDLPLELPTDAKVGFTMLDTWCAYSPVKNSPDTARDKVKTGNHPQSATSGESDLFTCNCRVLRMLGVQVEAPLKATFNGIEVEIDARVVWSPQWALGFVDVEARLPQPAKVKISQRSTLILDGDIIIEELVLDGALVIVARPGCRVRILRLNVANEGWDLQAATGEEDEVVRIRGFKVQKKATKELIYSDPGEYLVDEKNLQH